MRAVTVKDLMTEGVLAVSPEDSLAELRDLMSEHAVRHMPVVGGDSELIGLVSHRDLLRNALIEQPQVPKYMEDSLLARLRVEDVMTAAVESVEPETDIRVAAQTMYDNKYGCLPVVEAGRLVGILTEADFVRLFLEGN